jgi:flagellar motor switch protein FliN/FliY
MGARSRIDLLAGLEMNVSVELGRTELTVQEVLGLGPGSVIELDRLAGEPVDILVNDKVIARGEVVVVDENFGVRIVEVVRRGAESEERTG